MNHIKLSINLGDADVIDLKITSGAMIGTLHLEKKGVSFSPPNHKKAPEHQVDWRDLVPLIALSNGFAKVKGQ